MTSLLFDSKFWDNFSADVRINKCWQCDDLDSDTISLANREDKLLIDRLPNDVRIRLESRRKAAAALKLEPNWSDTVYVAFFGLAKNQESKEIQLIRDSQMIDTLNDYAAHSHYFQIVSDLMESASHPFVPEGQRLSVIHDIDKLDPIMLAAYSEKFDDGLDTWLWRHCMTRHVVSNLHHQQHPLWHSQDSPDDYHRKSKAMLEMICDKVSRKVQKDMNGFTGPDMWVVDESWFGDLPRDWLTRINTTCRQIADNIKF